MIRFTPLTDAYIESIASELRRGSEGDFLLSYLRELCEDTDDVFSAAICLTDGCLLTRRCYDGVYEFTLPFPYLAENDAARALDAIDEYARRQEIPLVYGDLTADDLEWLTERYAHPCVHNVSLDGDGALYVIEALTEAMDVETLPTLSDGTLTLRAPSEEDVPSYARLCRDESILSVWGYDFRCDYPDATDRQLYELTLHDFALRTALPFFMELDGVFVGEALLYAFDAKGGAECGIRVLPEARRRGIAKRALTLLCSYAFHTLGMAYIDSVCKTENLPSRAFLDGSGATLEREQDGCLFYRIHR